MAVVVKTGREVGATVVVGAVPIGNDENALVEETGVVPLETGIVPAELAVATQ